MAWLSAPSIFDSPNYPVAPDQVSVNWSRENTWSGRRSLSFGEVDVLPFATAKNIDVLVFGPSAHDLLGGHLARDTPFMLKGESAAREFDAVAQLIVSAVQDQSDHGTFMSLCR